MKAKEEIENPSEPAAPDGIGRFAKWAMPTLHALRIELEKYYRRTIDLLIKMPDLVEVIVYYLCLTVR